MEPWKPSTPVPAVLSNRACWMGMKAGFSFASSSYDIYLPNDALQTANGYYFWSAYAYGYQTRLQSLQGTAYDAFTFRFDWDMDYYRCLWSKEYSRRTVASS